MREGNAWRSLDKELRSACCTRAKHRPQHNVFTGYLLPPSRKPGIRFKRNLRPPLWFPDAKMFPAFFAVEASHFNRAEHA